MNDTKWNEIFRAFYYGIECSDGDDGISELPIKWTTKTVDGYIYSDNTWSHFCCDNYKNVEWLKIDINDKTAKLVIDTLRKIHVPGEIFEDCVYVYGYRTDINYI